MQNAQGQRLTSFGDHNHTTTAIRALYLRTRNRKVHAGSEGGDDDMMNDCGKDDRELSLEMDTRAAEYTARDATA